MTDQMHFRLNLGAVVLAILCTAAIVISNLAPAPFSAKAKPSCTDCVCPTPSGIILPAVRPGNALPTGEIGKSTIQEQSDRTNHSALNEIKFQDCIPCNLANQTPTVGRPTYVATRQGDGVQKYELALFLGNDAKSRQVASWFSTDLRLAELASRCSFQTYFPNNPLYKTRFGSIIPVDQFPAVLFLKNDGGHVHAAGGNMLPNSADEMFSDLVESYKLSKSVEASSGDRTGLIKEKGYSWDAGINPSMQLQGQDCGPDGCPDPFNTPVARPGDRVRDLLNGGSSRNAVVWAGPSEIAVFVILGLVVLLAVAVALKRMKG